MTYFECVQALQLLTDAGRAGKNFLGQYTDAEMARWADVVKRFESGAVFLVDTAQFLTQRVGYELPALKKDLVRAEKELAELQRRTTEYSRMAEASRARFSEVSRRQARTTCQLHPSRSIVG